VWKLASTLPFMVSSSSSSPHMRNMSFLLFRYLIKDIRNFRPVLHSRITMESARQTKSMRHIWSSTQDGIQDWAYGRGIKDVSHCFSFISVANSESYSPSTYSWTYPCPPSLHERDHGVPYSIRAYWGILRVIQTNPTPFTKSYGNNSSAPIWRLSVIKVALMPIVIILLRVELLHTPEYRI
jgi:hypothetical protein